MIPARHRATQAARPHGTKPAGAFLAEQHMFEQLLQLHAKMMNCAWMLSTVALLSFLASLQAPVIMMSQNRQKARDWQHAEGDCKINLKAELEIRLLHEKADCLLHQQATRLMEVQQLQIELLRELAHERGKPQA